MLSLFVIRCWCWWDCCCCCCCTRMERGVGRRSSLPLFVVIVMLGWRGGVNYPCPCHRVDAWQGDGGGVAVHRCHLIPPSSSSSPLWSCQCMAGQWWCCRHAAVVALCPPPPPPPHCHHHIMPTSTSTSLLSMVMSLWHWPRASRHCCRVNVGWWWWWCHPCCPCPCCPPHRHCPRRCVDAGQGGAGGVVVVPSCVLW